MTATLPVSFSFGAAFGANWGKQFGVINWAPRNRNRIVRRKDVEAQIEMFSSEDFDVERFLGSQGYINVSRYRTLVAMACLSNSWASLGILLQLTTGKD